MKKLSLKNEDKRKYYTLSKEINEIIISDDFSGYNTKESRSIKGSCMSCESRYCLVYSNEEISPEKFIGFEKNSTRRVCPTNAIKIGEDNRAEIDKKLCVLCGLCIHRCPYAAIQFSIEKKSCYINKNVEISKENTKANQDKEIIYLRKLNININFSTLTKSFSSEYQKRIINEAKKYSDLSEIIVRNTLINLGYKCATKPAGNNYIRTEFFTEIDNKVLIGESEITNTDTLSVCRRILDDISVLISRYDFVKEDILPLAIINGLPNKRTDYYEVVTDIKNILDVQIYTITYYILFVIQLYKLPFNVDSIKQFIVNKNGSNLTEAVMSLKKNIKEIDENIDKSNNYIPEK